VCGDSGAGDPEAAFDLDDLADDDDSFFVGGFAPSDDEIAVLIESYFDESFDKNILCVAGYIFTRPKGRLLDEEWRRMLVRYKLPYFRMSACNHGSFPFDRLTKQERIAVQTEAIRLIGKYAVLGSTVTIDQDAFYKIVTRRGFIRTPYEFCVWTILSSVLVWMQHHPAVIGARYFFESGHDDEHQAHTLMKTIFRAPDLRTAYKYKGHGFVDKQSTRPIQCADILAWQWFKDFIRRHNGISKRRADCEALLSGTPHYVQHTNEQILRGFLKRMDEMAGGPGKGNEIAALALRNPSLFRK
jgi:hypothetical protein